MKRLVVGLAALAAAVLGLSATGSAQNWGHIQRQERCPEMGKPYCGYSGRASCTSSGWQCVDAAGSSGGNSSSYNAPRQSSESCMETMPNTMCQAGWYPKCHNGHWRCAPP